MQTAVHMATALVWFASLQCTHSCWYLALLVDLLTYNATDATIVALLPPFGFGHSHCYDQKQEFGAAAMAEFPYVECFPQGWKKVRQAVHMNDVT
jgi:hypothetical protein